MEEMTLTRALAEVKLIENKLARFTNSDVTWVAMSRNNTILNGTVEANQLKPIVEANKQKLTDLMTRRNAIKHALLVANNQVIVTVAGTSYTIAQAIDRKAFIKNEKNIFNNINYQVVNVTNAFAAEELKQEMQINKMIETTLGAEGKKDAAVIATITDAQRAKNILKIEDPVGIKDWVAAKIAEFEEFEHEIDFSLSEVNAKNTIKF